MTDYLFGAMVQPNTPISIGGAIVAANVSVTGTGLPTVGIFSPSTNQLGFATNSTQAAVLDANGNMGLGTTSPTQKLQVNGGAAIITNAGANCILYLDSTNTYIRRNTSDGSFVINNENASNTIFSTGGTERMRIDSAGNVSINTTTINTGNKLTVAGTINITDATANRLYMGFGTIPSTGGSGAWIYNSDNSSLVFGTNNTERLRVDTFGNVGLNSTNPVAYDTSGGKVFNIRGTAANSAPATIFMNGDSSLPGAGYTTQEVFRISVTASQEITRLTGTGANGFRMMFRVSLCGHTGAIGNGHIYAMYYWDGGTAAPVQIFRYDSTTNVPSLTFNTTTSNVLIINLSSSGGVNLFQGVMVVEYFVPVDFASSTYTVS